MHRLGLALLLLTVPAVAGKPKAKFRPARPRHRRPPRHRLRRPDDTSAKVTEILPGREMVITERNGPWIKVFANTDSADQVEDEPEFNDDEKASPDSGWIKDKGVVTPQTPHGDTILFGAAANLEDEAERPHAPKDAASRSPLPLSPRL